MKLENLASNILSINSCLKNSATKAINKHVTTRNWLTGYCIVEYEQNGEDRAKYGERILQSLAERINDEGLSYTNLKLYRQFYLTYPQLRQPVEAFIYSNKQIGQSMIGQLQQIDFQEKKIGQSLIVQSSCGYDTITPPEQLFGALSYTHLVQMLPMKDSLERSFYEIACINGTWSVRELKRQIASNLYVRTGLSWNKEKAIAMANEGAAHTSIQDTIKSPYTFEFLGLKAKDVIEESDLESALMDHLQEFMLELGHGFCFEARQKRILIDEEYFFYDLLFYNRILHCGVILELKASPLNYKDVAQLNMYLNYYKKNYMIEGDNPPVGILLCTAAGKETVEYATAGMDENLFVSKYELTLPDKEQIREFLMQMNKEDNQ